MKAQRAYEIRIAGRLDGTALESFEGLDVAFRAGVTVVTGRFDQAALHGMFEMMRLLGLELLEARRVSGSPGRRTAQHGGRRAGDGPG